VATVAAEDNTTAVRPRCIKIGFAFSFEGAPLVLRMTSRSRCHAPWLLHSPVSVMRTCMYRAASSNSVAALARWVLSMMTCSLPYHTQPNVRGRRR